MVRPWPESTANRVIPRRRKKKVADELKRFFPKRFSQIGGERNQLEQYRRYLLAKVAHLLNPVSETEAALNTAFGLIVGQHKPACFREGEGHVLIQMEKGYEKLLVTLAECGCPDPDKLTVFQFYTWLETLEDKYEAQQEALKSTQHAAKR